jgi:hypothetical protein
MGWTVIGIHLFDLPSSRENQQLRLPVEQTPTKSTVSIAGRVGSAASAVYASGYFISTSSV